MKKRRNLLTILILSVILSACSRGGQGQNQSSGEASSTQESSSGQDSGSSKQSQSESQSSEQESSGQATQVDMSEGWSQEMEDIKNAVVNLLGDDYWPNAGITPEMLESTYGISQDMYDDYLAEMPIVGVNVDTLIIVKAKDGQAPAVEEALNNYREDSMTDTSLYPMNLGKIEASRIQSFDNYVCFVQLGADTTAAEENGEAAIITQCQEQNEMVLEIIGDKVMAQ